MLAGGLPEGTDTQAAAKISVVVHALCARDTTVASTCGPKQLLDFVVPTPATPSVTADTARFVDAVPTRRDQCSSVLSAAGRQSAVISPDSMRRNSPSTRTVPAASSLVQDAL